MGLVKVYNDNVHPFTQKFKGEVITVPAKSFIEMELEEAVAFKSYPSPMKFDGMGQQDPKSYKMLRVEGSDVAKAVGERVQAYRCHQDGSLHPTKEALEAHVKQISDTAFADEEGLKVAKSKRKVTGDT